jgi:acetyl esterase/lipase
MLAQARRNEVSGMAFSRSALLAAMAVLLASAAAAQQAPMSEDLVWKLLEIGRVVDPSKTVALFAPMQENEPYQGVKTEREIKYGPADRHLLDVFTPETAASARPVLIFIHGGAFVGGNKRTAPSSPFYDNVMLWAVHNGFVGVNAIGSRRNRPTRRAPRTLLPSWPGSRARSAHAAAIPRASI